MPSSIVWLHNVIRVTLRTDIFVGNQRQPDNEKCFWKSFPVMSGTKSKDFLHIYVYFEIHDKI